MSVSVQVNRKDGVAEIHAQCHFPQAREHVFDFFAAHENLSHVFGGKIWLSQPAPEGDNPNGLGSVRTISMGPGPNFDERIEAFDKNSRIEYTITQGSPVKNHYGTMLFTDADGGTAMDYRIRLAGRIPGTTGLIAGIMARTLRKGLPKATGFITSG